MELCPNLCAEARKTLGDGARVTCIGMQNYAPDNFCDLFWFQWCIGHLTDVDFVALLVRLKEKLKPNGFIVIKDNFTSSGSAGCLFNEGWKYIARISEIDQP